MTTRDDVEDLKRLKMGRMLLTEQEEIRLSAVLERGDDTKNKPTTAEAFSTARREWMEACSPTGTPNSTAFTYALTLLERRMGAMARAMEDAARHFEALVALGALARHAGYGAAALARATDLRAALTDAPPVFALEEVKKAVADAVCAIQGPAHAETIAHETDIFLSALRSTGGGR